MILFAGTLILSAALLFLVQLMFAKMVLPLLGGTPAVWNTCMVFFQAMLLGGYAYAHWLTTRLPLRRQLWVHLSVLAVGLCFLPPRVPAFWGPPLEQHPILWLFALLATVVGWPFWAASATAPLLQRWFALTQHARAHNPYQLYAASNFGSFLGLLSYPLFIEPQWPVAAQRWAWAVGYGGLLLGMACCAGWLLRHLRQRLHVLPMPQPADTGAEARTPTPVTGARKMRWVFLAFVPSSLLMGVTTYLSTDIAALPLLWVIPLALYLATFILTFADRPPLPHRRLVWLMPFAVLPLVVLTGLGWVRPGWLLVPLHLLVFFLAAMVCHGELAQDRPAVRHLTAFYFWISLGGVLGGMFNALVAPVIFAAVWEYPLMMILACGARPGYPPQPPHLLQKRLYDYVFPVLLGMLWLWLNEVLPPMPDDKIVRPILLYAPCALFCYLFRYRPVRFALGVGVLLFVGVVTDASWERLLYFRRSFFGVYRVAVDWHRDQYYHSLSHGTTLHGMQSLAASRRCEPLTYYSRPGPLGDIFRSFETAEAPRLRHVGVVGLGAGTTAAYSSPGQAWTFYEIDPLVKQLALDPRYFRFLESCIERQEIVLGDARLSLQQAAPATFDLLVLDAFSSDAIPMHLMTREALQLYLKKLAPQGLLAFHISNRYLDLEPVLADLADAEGLVCRMRQDQGISEEEKFAGKTASIWVVLARQQSDLGLLDKQREEWVPIDRKGQKVSLWTDDYSNLWQVLRLR